VAGVGNSPASSGASGGSSVAGAAATAGGDSGGSPAIGGAAAGQATGGSATGGTGVSGAGSTGVSGAAGNGMAGAPAGGVGGGPTACPGDAVFCDDFESYAEMTQPNGKWKTWTVGNGTLLVDAARGTKAAHFHGQVSQSGATKEQAFMLAQQAPAFPVAGKTFYLRFMLYGTRFPFTGVSTANHVAMAWIGSTKALNSPDRGATDEGFILADYNGVSIEPMWSGYYRDTSKHFKDANQANGWHCWEVEIDHENGPPAGGATGPALPHIWEDGSELKLSEKGGGNYAAVPFEALLFSLWSPQSDNAVADYWVDDVVVSKSRINCPVSK
jgi:hypothetical protein